MKRFKYPALVKTEAKNLKKFATKEELERLTTEGFNPVSKWDCIYGKLTGCCFSDRANELIQKCAPRVYIQDERDDNKLSTKLNGKLKEPRKRMEHWSPIEVFIYPQKRKEAAIRLLKYLKGEIKTL